MQPILLTVDQNLVRYRSYRVHHPDAWVQFEGELEKSWLYHDFALDGVALTEGEVRLALAGEPGRHYAENQVFERIRQTMAAIEATCDLARTNLGELTLDDIKGFHVLLCDAEDPSAGRYRKSDGPASAYSHTVTKPPSISYRLRKLVDALDTEYGDLHPVRAAGYLHHDLMTTWPFDDRSGTAARLLLSYWLMRAGYPPAIIVATERHHYHAALDGPPEQMVEVVAEAVLLTMSSAETFFEGRGRQVTTWESAALQR